LVAANSARPAGPDRRTARLAETGRPKLSVAGKPIGGNRSPANPDRRKAAWREAPIVGSPDFGPERREALPAMACGRRGRPRDGRRGGPGGRAGRGAARRAGAPATFGLWG
jgi:hypothetical protein